MAVAFSMFLLWPAHAEVTRQEQINFVKDAWDLTDLTDSVISTTLDTSYSGIPYKDFVSYFFVAPEILNPLANGDYKTAGTRAVDFATGEAISALLANAGLAGVVAPAKLAAWPIQHSLSLFQNAVTEASFKNQIKLYLAARSAGNSYSAILALGDGDVMSADKEILGNQRDIITKLNGWLAFGTSYLVGPVPGYTPDDFYDYAERQWQAYSAIDRYAADQEIIRDAFRAAAAPQKPVIIQQPQDAIVGSGENATFTVVASGTGPFSYVWRFNGAILPAAAAASLTATAPGEYKVEVSNGAGTTPSRIATLTVSTGEPVVITTPTPNATLSGSFIVRASATGATKVEFFLDGVRQATDSAAPYAWTWNTISAANGQHTLTAKAYDGATLLGTSAGMPVTVNNAPTSPCNDPAEPNNSSLTATTLAVGGSASGYVCSATDVDWFKVTVTGTGPLTFNLTVPAQNDYDLELFGPDFTFVKGSYRDVGQSESATVNQLGTYYARVYGYPVGSGSFSTTIPYALNCLLNGTNLGGPGGTVVSWGIIAIPYVEPGTRFTAIAAGVDYSLALKNDGTVVAWGANDYGQSRVPQGLSGVTAISAGLYHSLALKNDGTVVAWGWNEYGQSAVPAGLSGVTAIAAGGNHSLALKNDGTVVAWGWNEYGQSAVPAGLSGVTSIAAGAWHSLALKSEGTVIAWGYDGSGRITVPAGLSDVTAMAAGGNHSLAPKSDGTVVAWGWNGFGQSTVPTGLSDVTTIAAGGNHSLVLKRDGTVVAWGWDDYGQSTVPTGLSDVTAIAAGAVHSLVLKSDGTLVAWGWNEYGQSTVPAGLGGVTAIAAGGGHSLALKSDGTVIAWGANDYGQSRVPQGLSGVTAISAGLYHSLALKHNGTVVAWGYNDFGQSTVPAGLEGVTAIAAGLYHTLALKSDGTVVAWGRSDSGESTVPVGLGGVTAIAAGVAHSLALKSDGMVVAWGVNEHGESTVPEGLSGVTAITTISGHNLVLKSDGTVVAWGWDDYGQSTVPTGLSDVTAIAAGGGHSLALKSDGMVVAWGVNRFGQSTVPEGLNDVTSIAAGGYHSLALVSDELFIATPTVQNQPQSQTIPIGETVSFTVAVAGTPPFTYQWFRNSATIAGATSATLTLFNAQPAQAGSYTVRITGPGGSVMSNPATLSFLEDSNNNGLPDAWELAHGFALDNPNTASADPDHDGTTNMQEYLAGTDPHSAASVFRVSITSSGISGFQIAFTTVPDKTYRVERAPSPSGPWTLLESNLPGTGSLLQVTDPASPNISRFYRIRTP